MTRQKLLPVQFDGQTFDEGYRADLIIDNKLIIELKCVEKILPVHEAQLMTYLKLSKLNLGLLLNFKTKLLKEGIKRMVYSHAQGTLGS